MPSPKRTNTTDGTASPYPMIVRLAGLPAEAVEPFSSDLGAAIAAQQAIEGELSGLRSALVDHLYARIEGAPSEERHFLLAVKRDCFNDRPLAKHRSRPLWSLVAEVAPEECHRLGELEELLETGRSELEDRYEEQLLAERRNLVGYVDHADLKRGLTLGSLVLAKELPRLKRRAPERFRRKERRVEETLLRYVTRAALKLSPFSTLTRIGLGEAVDEPLDRGIDLGSARGWQERCAVRLRRMMLDQHSDVLRAYPPFRERLSVVLNDTLEKPAPRARRFLKPAAWRHPEGASELEYVNSALVRAKLGGPLIEWLEANLPGRKITYRQLLAELESTFDSEPAVLASTIDKLLALGFLDFVLPWTTRDLHLERKMVEALRASDPDPRLETYVDLLEDQIELQETYSTTEAPVAVVEQSKEQVEAIWQSLAPLGGIDPAVRYYERPMDHYFAEDVFLTPLGAEGSALARVGQEEAGAVATDIDPLARLANLFSTRCDFLHSLATFAGQRWPGAEQVRFIEVFQEAQPLFQELVSFDREARLPGALENPKVFNPLGSPRLEELLEWRQEIGPASWECNRPVDDEQHLDVEKLAGLLDEVPEPYAASRDFCAFVQPLRGGRWVLNCLFEGMGRMSSRYNTLMNEEERRRWTDYFTERSVFEEDGELRELVDIFCPAGHTINVHAPQTRRVIEVPGESSGLAPERRLGLRELAIRFPDDGRLPWLVGPEGHRLLPLHLGGLVFRFMPNLFKFLTFFGPGEFRYRIPRVPEQRHGELWLIPRHVVGSVVYMRRTWIANREDLLPMVEGHRPVEVFEAINRWRLDHGIPERVFVTEPMAGGLSNPRRKPQYVDFGSPLLVEIFRSVVRVDFQQVRIVEALPSPEDLCPAADGRRWAVEIQLDNFGLF